MTELERAIALYRAGRLAEAEPLFAALYKRNPADYRLAVQLGAICVRDQRPADALRWLDQAKTAAPANDPQPDSWLCFAHAALGNDSVAFQHGARAVRHVRNNATLYHQLGTLAQKLQRMGDATRYLTAALDLKPDNADAWHDLGISFHYEGRLDDAIEAYRRALDKQPDNPHLHYNLTLSLLQTGDTAAAVHHCERAVALFPDYLEARYRLGYLYRLTCDWSAFDGLLPELTARIKRHIRERGAARIDAYALNVFGVDQSLHNRLCEYYAAQIAADVAGHELPAAPVVAEGPLRIGYLSADFGHHAVGGLVHELFGKHDREHVHVSGYSLRVRPGEFFDSAKAGFDSFVDVDGLSDVAIAERIRADGIQILIDLNGYTLNGRPAVMALRPAPVQVSWLGYLNTMMADYIDYVIVDRVARPAEEMAYRERLAVLDTCFLPGSRLPRAAARPRAEYALPDGQFVFASFNNSYKISRDLFAAWCEILRQAPDSVLWLYAGANPAAEKHLCEAFAGHGLADERLVLAGQVPMSEHMGRSAYASLMLDSWGYGGGATSVAAAQAGVPTLTLAGDNLLARMGASVNHALGVDALTVTTPDDYVARAVQLARDPGGLEELRKKLKQSVAAGGLDPGRVAAELETLYRNMWRRHTAGERPTELSAAAGTAV